MTEERTPCAVPFCHRSRKGRWAWWLCKEHYALVPMAVRARHRQLKAACKRKGWIWSDKTSWRPTTWRARRIMDAAGREVTRAAQARAAGL